MPPTVARARAITLRLILAAAYFYHTIHIAVLLYASPLYWKQDYHTSVLTGEGWVKELIRGNPNRIKCELGMRLHVYLALVANLHVLCGLRDSKHVTLREQVAIFLYQGGKVL
ncbi:hypothetical protein C8F04DRAFT_969412 [Mycena alexandri]|uniref:DUF8040 domain-containing protein n=1 Tax=Mycena alexandri TaxID=1745969 RepID=A0AAD6RZ96_9AGAR|nr:hypothetical protein C8F04DRAFT_979543 [Mycena alexandri]KAJ7024130.1 hypothetical protein C8F04DRAFT_969412 [Mycena alexandri]